MMGQNADIQKKYWNLLKSSKWNENQPNMPKYSILEAVLAENPNFDNLDDLTLKIIDSADSIATEITQYLKSIL